MIDVMPSALTDALTLLTELQHNGTRPDQARNRLHDLQSRYPDLRIDLLSEAEAYDDSVHYDVLLRRPGEGTISLAYSPDRALPWPMRGAQRWSEGHLMRVNGKVVRVSEAMALMDFMWDQAPVTDRLINASLVQEELEREPITLSHEQIQRAMDAFRRRRGLFTAEAALRWMRDRGLSIEDLEQLVGDDARLMALRDRVVGDRVESYFEEHREAFETAHVARCGFADEGSARRALERIRSGAVEFLAVAQERFVADPATGGEVFGTIRKGLVPSEVEQKIFAAAPGDIVGPVLTRDGEFAIFHVIGVKPVSLDAATRSEIRQTLFREWLDARRRDATVEWYWGTPDHTAREV